MKYTHKARHHLLGIAVTCTALAVSPALAATEDGQFAVRGLGAHSCADIVAAVAAENNAAASAQLASWVAGYLSHANRTTDGVFDVMPIQDIYDVATIIARICERNPDSYMEQVAASVIQLVASSAQDAVSELTPIEHDDQSVLVRQAVLKTAQQALIARGSLPEGSDDGVYGRNTRNAFVDFQQANSLAPTGLPDSMTLFLLLTTQ